MLTKVTHILELKHFRIARMLPVEGQVLVYIGQRVHATDLIAETVLKPTHVQLDIQKVLGKVSSGKAKKMVQRRIGEHVAPGDIIASSGGIFERILRAPQAGIIDYLSADTVMLQVQGPKFQLLAGISGEVVEIIPDRGAIIEANGTRIQGAWGNGRINSGALSMLTDTAADEVNVVNLNRGAAGEVLAGGYCEKPTVLKALSKMDINGLIMGSMSADLCGLAKELPFPIVLVDGFGNSPMNGRAYQLLHSNTGRETSVMAVESDSYSGERPEIFIEGIPDGIESSDMDHLNTGQIVRILSYPYFGCTGTIESLQDDPARFPSGLRSAACSVKLDDGQIVLVPASNLDILG